MRVIEGIPGDPATRPARPVTNPDQSAVHTKSATFLVSPRHGEEPPHTHKSSQPANRRRTTYTTMFPRLLLCLAVAAQAFAADDIKTDEGVLVLTKGNFKNAIADNEYVLVEFCEYFCSGERAGVFLVAWDRCRMHTCTLFLLTCSFPFGFPLGLGRLSSWGLTVSWFCFFFVKIQGRAF